jgi:hypothetical protein
MKTKIKYIVVLAAFLSLACLHINSAAGASYVIGISPHHDTSQRKEVLAGILVFALETAEPGDSITVCDALNQKLVASFTIPEGSLFKSNAKARAQRLGVAMTSLKEFILKDRSYPSVMANVIALPQFLDFAASQLRSPGESLRVVVLASALYIDTNPDAACSMQSAFPSDANLTAEPHQSVFGCAFRRQTLNGVTVHLAYLKTPFVNDYHQERIGRFWALYCQQTGGTLNSWCADSSLAFRRAKENIQQSCIQAQLDSNDTKIEMRQVSRRSVVASRSVTNDVGRLNTTSVLPVVTSTATSSAIREPVTTQNQVVTTATVPSGGNGQVVYGRDALVFEPAKLAEAFPVKPAAKSFGVGIAWSASVDLDLWLAPYPGAAELSFHNTNSPQGRYLQDWRSGNLGLDYEYVLLNPDQIVSLSTLPQIECWVNYYSGNVTPVRGIMVVHFDGRAYQGEFTINAPSGNQAGERNARDRSRHWVRIDLAAIVRSGQSVQSASASR